MSQIAPTSAQAPCPLCQGMAHHAYTTRDFLHAIPGLFDYYLCSHCGAQFQQPMPDPARIASFYPADYSVHAPQAGSKPPRALERAVLAACHGYRHLLPESHILRRLARCTGRLLYRHVPRHVPQFVAGGRLLDIGCGNGKFLLKMRGLGWRCQGLDFSAQAVQVCRQHGLEVSQGDLDSAGFAAASFDAITARHLIEHVPDPLALLGGMARILKPGGRLYLETPNTAALLRAWFGIHWFANDAPRHLVLFSRATLLSAARRCGLDCVSVTTSASPKCLLNSLDYRAGRRQLTAKRSHLRRALARPYLWIARALDRGDVLHAVFVKP